MADQQATAALLTKALNVLKGFYDEKADPQATIDDLTDTVGNPTAATATLNPETAEARSPAASPRRTERRGTRSSRRPGGPAREASRGSGQRRSDDGSTLH